MSGIDYRSLVLEQRKIVFLAGGNYPTTEVPFPQMFPEAVHAEIEATRNTN
jgi:hypothetical protein